MKSCWHSILSFGDRKLESWSSVHGFKVFSLRSLKGKQNVFQSFQLLLFFFHVFLQAFIKKVEVLLSNAHFYTFSRETCYHFEHFGEESMKPPSSAVRKTIFHSRIETNRFLAFLHIFLKFWQQRDKAIILFFFKAFNGWRLLSRNTGFVVVIQI